MPINNEAISGYQHDCHGARESDPAERGPDLAPSLLPPSPYRRGGGAVIGSDGVGRRRRRRRIRTASDGPRASERQKCLNAPRSQRDKGFPRSASCATRGSGPYSRESRVLYYKGALGRMICRRAAGSFFPLGFRSLPARPYRRGSRHNPRRFDLYGDSEKFQTFLDLSLQWGQARARAASLRSYSLTRASD
jgi:hypothetical protein